MRLLVLVFVCFYGFSWGQDVDLSDGQNGYQVNNQVWLKTKAVLPLRKKSEVSTQYVSRIYLNGLTPGSYFYLSGKHNFKKWLSGDVVTRFVMDQGYNLYRFEAGLKLKKKIEDFQFAFRTAAFHEDKTYAFTRELSKAGYFFMRNRVEASWSPKKKWEFGTSFEVWNLFNYHNSGKLDKGCVIFDMEYKLSKHHSFTLSYQNQFDIHRAHKTALNMYCVGYVYTLKKIKKEKE